MVFRMFVLNLITPKIGGWVMGNSFLMINIPEIAAANDRANVCDCCTNICGTLRLFH